MSSRRPITRAFSANGRLGSINEEDMPVPDVRADSRNYLTNVRPENRSTLCSVMAQLTEETQPSFDTTLKSRAVSEDSNVKFTCEVSGYPVPELTWYKDDMEMDRYCGLPKYEIFRNGKVHTLQIYNCTVEDAAIYQASAKNPKGIVSCSGVLEVGAMNEFKIHQQFFSKLKHKADAKRKELEESRRREIGKENVQATVPELLHPATPERPPRKRRSPSEPGLRVPATLRDREPEVKGRPQAEVRLQEGARTDVLEQPPTATDIPNGFPADDRRLLSSDLTKPTEKEKDNQERAYVYETVEIITTKRRPTKEPLATKRPKISKGVVAGDVHRETAQERKSKKDEREEGGMSLAQYLAESLKSQEYENKQNSEQEVMEVDVKVLPEKEKDAENLKILEEVNANAKSPPSKQPEPPNSQGSLSSVFFSLRDIFFGSKSNEVIKTAENVPQQKPVTAAEKEPPSEPSLPDSKLLHEEPVSQAKDLKTPAEEIIQMDIEEPLKPPPRRAGLRSASSRHIAPQKVPADAAKEKWPGLDSHNQGDTVSKSPSSVVEEPGGGRMQTEEGIGALETANLPAEPEPLLAKVADDHMQTERNAASVDKDQVMTLHEPEAQVPGVFPGEQVIADTSETDTLSDRDRTDLSEPIHSVQPRSSGSGGISLETKADQQRFGRENIASQDGAQEPEHSPTADRDLVGKAGDAVKESDKHVEEDRVESGANKSQVFSFAVVEDNVEMGNIASLLKTAQREGAKTISESEEEEKKDVSNEQITVQPMTVEFNLPNVSQPEESMTDIPKVNIPQPKVPEAVGNLSPHRASPNQESTVPEFAQLEATVTSVPKIYIQESSDGQKIPFEKSDLEPLTTFVEKDSDSLNENISDKDVLSTQVSQKEQEKTKAKETAARVHLDKTMAEASIPVINVCLSDDSELWFDPEPHKVKYPTVTEPVVEKPPTGQKFVVPPISITSADDTPEEYNEPKDEVTKKESVPYFIYDVSEDMGLKRSESPCLEDKEDISPTASVPEETEDIKDSVGPVVVDEPSETIVLSQSDLPDLSAPAPETSVTKTPPLITYIDQDQEITQTELQAIDEPQTFVDKLQKDKSVIEGPEQPMLSPTSLRKFAAKNAPDLEAPSLITVPAIQVEDFPTEDQLDDEETGADSPPSVPSTETSPRLGRKDSLTLIPSATPQELASGARRKIFLSKSKGDESEGAEKEELQKKRALPQELEPSYMSPTVPRRSSLLQTPAGQQNPPTWSPQVPRRKATLEVPKRPEELLDDIDTTQTDDKPEGKETLNPFKAPQVIRKIRGEPFPDALGHLKIWCQFFNVLSDSTIKWYRDEVEVAELKRSAGDESQVALAIVQTSSRDCGVYTCTIKNEYGTDTTDFLLSAEILHNFLLRGDLEVGEEIEMTPMVYTKGLAHPGYWGDKFFGRIMIQEAHLGEGCAHKACRVKVIYGLEPVFESGSTCIIKARNPIAYSVKDEISLAEKNLDLTKQECKIQNTAREYCKVFAAEARAIENFGTGLEMLPRYLMYRPANTVPYATVEVDIPGVYQKYCTMDASGRLVMRNSSELEQKCCAFQHWIHQWTSGNLLVTQLEGIEARITNVGIATKSKGYLGLPDRYNPQVFEQFVLQHQCNYYCGLLGLRTMKPIDSQPVLAKIKGSRSPLLNRRGGPCASPQLPRKGVHSPQAVRKTTSPKVPRKSGESGDNGKPAAKPKTTEAPKTVATS